MPFPPQSPRTTLARALFRLDRAERRLERDVGPRLDLLEQWERQWQRRQRRMQERLRSIDDQLMRLTVVSSEDETADEPVPEDETRPQAGPPKLGLVGAPADAADMSPMAH